MTSSFTGLATAKPDIGQYKKVQKFWNNTAGVDLSAGGIFVVASGQGIVAAAASADIAGIILDGVASAASAMVDMYCGLGDLFTGVVSTTTNGASAILDGANCYALTSGKLATAIAGLDIVGQLQDNKGLAGASADNGKRVIFSLTPSNAIPGYDSGNTA